MSCEECKHCEVKAHYVIDRYGERDIEIDVVCKLDDWQCIGKCERFEVK